MIGLNISASCQNQDSSLIANKDLRKAAIIIEQAKSAKQEIKLWQQRNELLSDRLSIKDSIITSHIKKGEAYESIIGAYKKIGTNYDETIAAMNTQFKQQISKQKRKTFIVSLIAALAIGVMIIK